MLERYLKISCDFLQTNWVHRTPDFAKFNLIFGWNGSGKTTFTRIFQALQHGKTPINWKFELIANGKRFTEQNTQELANQFDFFVFNNDYTTSMFYTDHTHIDFIFYIGKESSSAARKRNAIAHGINNIKDKITVSTKELDNIKIDKLTSSTAKEIKNNALSSTNTLYRNFTKTEAQQLFDDFCEGTTPEDLTILSGDELAKLIAQKNSNNLPPIQPINAFDDSFCILFKSTIDAYASAINLSIPDVLGDFLHSEFQSWAERGHALHKQYGYEICQFCGNTISTDLEKTFETFFSTTYQQLKVKISDAYVKIHIFKSALKDLRERLPNTALFFEHLRRDHSHANESVKLSAIRIIDFFDFALDTLKQKENNPRLSFTIDPCDLQQLNSCILSINRIIEAHNDISQNHDKMIKSSQAKIAKHYILSNLDEYKEMKTKRSVLDSLSKKLKDAETILKNKLKNASSTINDRSTPAIELTNELAEYLGRKELEFQDQNGGYTIKKNGKSITHLSEGEKSAIAYLHYLKSLQAAKKRGAKIIAVIDDPVSSLDTNSLYSSYAHTVFNIKDAYQAFVLTHNFMFHRLIKHWIQRQSTKERIAHQIYNFDSIFNDDTRTSRLIKASPALTKYETEYYYLFATCYKCSTDCDPQECGEKCYGIPNIARRLIETFLAFSFPSKTSLSGMLEYHPQISETDKKILYSLTNDYSHASMPGRDYYDKSILENIPQIASATMRAIESQNPEHFSGMKKALNLI